MPKWTGFGDKTIWDWLSLLIVPIMLAGATGIFTLFELEREDRRAQQQRDLEQARAISQQEIEAERARQAVLQTYIRDMTDLLLENELKTSKDAGLVRQIARSNTLTAVRQLDSNRKAILLNFLHGAGLIEASDSPIVELRFAFLTDANLQGAELGSANLRDAYLDRANLTWANLKEADLSGANLIDADLSAANLADADLSGADLSGALFGLANLSNANLSGADLSGTLLGDANLSNANLSGASGLTATELCRAKSLYQATGLLESLSKEIEKQCPEKLLETRD